MISQTSHSVAKDTKAEETYHEQALSNKIGEIRLEISYIFKCGPTKRQINSFLAEGKVNEMTKQMTPHCTR